MFSLLFLYVSTGTEDAFHLHRVNTCTTYISTRRKLRANSIQMVSLISDSLSSLLMTLDFVSAEPIFMCGDHCAAVVPVSTQDTRLNRANGTSCVSSTQF